MIRKRVSASVGIATALATVGSVLAMPVAHADPLDPIRGAVNAARAQSTCGPLNYSVALEGEAQAAVENTLPGVPPAGQYNGTFHRVYGWNDPQDAAIKSAINNASGLIKDCTYKDYGVGFIRVESHGNDGVGIALGIPAAPPAGPPPQGAPPQQQAPPPDVQCPPDSPVKSVPPGQTCPAAPPVTDAISLTFGPVQGFFPANSITATISNSSDLPAKCTYDATPSNTHRNFTVAAHGSSPLTFSGVATGTTYHATVTCNDSSGKQSQPIGTASQDVSF
jgi:hypothetical protein